MISAGYLTRSRRPFFPTGEDEQQSLADNLWGGERLDVRPPVSPGPMSAAPEVKLNQGPTARPAAVGGMSKADMLLIMGAMLRGGDSLNGVSQLIGMRQKTALQAKQDEAEQDLSAALLPAPDGAAPNLRDPRIYAAVLRAARNGVDVGPALEVLKAQKRQYESDGGVVWDPETGDPVRALPTPPVGGGFIPRPGVDGEIAGWDNAPGVPKALAERRGAESGADAAARAPFETVTGQDRSGRPVLTKRSDVTGPQGTPLVGQSPAEAITANKAAEAEAERQAAFQKSVDEDAKIAPLLNEMESLLDSGDVISGMGADLRLNAERALALTGDDRAKARVAATEGWKNLTARQVLPLVKQLGTGAGITDADRKFTESIVAGDIALDEQTMRRVIAIGRRQMEANRQRQESGAPARRARPPGGTGGYRVLSVE